MNYNVRANLELYPTLGITNAKLIDVRSGEVFEGTCDELIAASYKILDDTLSSIAVTKDKLLIIWVGEKRGNDHGYTSDIEAH